MVPVGAIVVVPVGAIVVAAVVVEAPGVVVAVVVPAAAVVVGVPAAVVVVVVKPVVVLVVPKKKEILRKVSRQTMKLRLHFISHLRARCSNRQGTGIGFATHVRGSMVLFMVTRIRG